MRLFVDGYWHFVVLDDQLPCGPEGFLRFARCRDPNSFWVPLLEKAFAKLYRSYTIIEGGNTAEALLTLTGEGAETIKVDEADFQRLMENGMPENSLKKWKKSRFLMGVSRYVEDLEPEAGSHNGILTGHAYSVLDVKNPTTEKGFLGMIGNKRTVLIKCRNPWGEQVRYALLSNEKHLFINFKTIFLQEWNGAWSDSSKEWTPAIRKQLKHEDKADGIFWMDMEDFFSHFNRLSVVRMYSHRMSIFDHKWHSFHFVNEWDEFTAGGCMNVDSWVKNPQYALDVLDKSGSTVFVYVSQPDRRLHNKMEYEHSIGCYILRVENNKVPLTDKAKVLKQETLSHIDDKNATFGSLIHERDTDAAPVFTNRRDVCLRVDLAPGSYVILPCTYEPNRVMQFSLGVFAEKKCRVQEILVETTSGVVVELPAEGGPPEAGPLARAEKEGDGKGVAFLQNPKLVLRFKKRQVDEHFHVRLRVEPQFQHEVLGVRIYKKTKPHQRMPLHPKNILEDFEPTGKTTYDLELDRDQGPFCVVPYAKTAGTTGKVNVSITTSERVKFEMYF